MSIIKVTNQIFLDSAELHFKFIHAQGPGGQNVNKVATAVQLQFDVLQSDALSDDVKQSVLAQAGNRATKKGCIVITAKRHRTQVRNRQEAIKRLVNIIKQAAKPPKIRKKTKPTKASVERRLKLKEHVSKKKEVAWESKLMNTTPVC